MRKSRFTDSQSMDAIKLVEVSVTVPEICRELSISSATFCKWRAKYGGMDVSMMSGMKELEAKNARLRKMYVEERLKAEPRAEAFEKSGEAISPSRNSSTCSAGVRDIGPAGLRDVWHQPDVLSPEGQT